MKLLSGFGSAIAPDRIEIAIGDGRELGAKPDEAGRRVVVAEATGRSRDAAFSRPREALQEECDRPEGRGDVEGAVRPSEGGRAVPLIERGGRDGDRRLERPEALVHEIEDPCLQAVPEDAQRVRLHAAAVVFPRDVVVLAVVAGAPPERVEPEPLLARETRAPVGVARDAVHGEEGAEEGLVLESEVPLELSDPHGADRCRERSPTLFQPHGPVVKRAESPPTAAHLGLRGEIAAGPFRRKCAIEELRESFVPFRDRFVIEEDRFDAEFREVRIRFHARFLSPRGGEDAHGEERGKRESTAPQHNRYITNESREGFHRRRFPSVLPSISKFRFTSSASRTGSRSSCLRSVESLS